MNVRALLHRSRGLVALAGLSVAVLGVLAGCGGTSTATSTAALTQPVIATDINGTPIVIPAQAPQRIISLTPGDSEMLGSLSLASRVVGVDAYTDYPAALASKPKVTDDNGNINVEQILALKPDLVLSWGGFFKQADQQLEAQHIEVVDLPQMNLSGTLKEILLVGQLTHTYTTAQTEVNSLQARIDAVKRKVAGAATPTVYMEVGFTPPPPYAYGGGSFGDELITDAGGVNIFHSDTTSEGYPQVSVESILAANPQVIVLTEDPRYGGDPNSVAQRQGWSVISAVQNHQVYQINSELIQEPGPRLVDALEQLAKDLHPELYS